MIQRAAASIVLSEICLSEITEDVFKTIDCYTAHYIQPSTTLHKMQFLNNKIIFLND